MHAPPEEAGVAPSQTIVLKQGNDGQLAFAGITVGQPKGDVDVPLGVSVTHAKHGEMMDGFSFDLSRTAVMFRGVQYTAQTTKADLLRHGCAPVEGQLSCANHKLLVTMDHGLAAHIEIGVKAPRAWTARIREALLCDGSRCKSRFVNVHEHGRWSLRKVADHFAAKRGLGRNIGVPWTWDCHVGNRRCSLFLAGSCTHQMSEPEAVCIGKQGQVTAVDLSGCDDMRDTAEPLVCTAKH